MLLKLASLDTYNVSIKEAAPTNVVSFWTYKLLFKLTSLVTKTLLLKLASLDNVRFPLIDRSSAIISV